MKTLMTELIIREEELKKLFELNELIDIKNFIKNSERINIKNKMLIEIKRSLIIESNSLITELKKYNSDLLFTDLHRRYCEYENSYHENIILHLYKMEKGDKFYLNVCGTTHAVRKVEL